MFIDHYTLERWFVTSLFIKLVTFIKRKRFIVKLTPEKGLPNQRRQKNTSKKRHNI